MADGQDTAPSGRRQQEGARSAAEEQLRILLDTVGEGVIIANPTREIILVNRVVEELWGYPERSLLGKELQYLLSMEAREGLLSVWADAERGISVRRLALEAYRRDGSSFPVEIGITRARIGGRLRFTVAVRDLSALRRAEDRLRGLDKALEAMPVGVTLSDLEGRLAYVNPAAARMYGFRPEELAGRDLRTLVPRSMWRSVEPAKLAETGPFRREEVCRRKRGDPFPVEIIPDVVTDAKGNPAAIVTLYHDISERKRAQAALKESEERYALAVQGANDGLWDWDLRSGEIYYSERWREMLGLRTEGVQAEPEEWFSRVHPEDLERLQEAIADHLDGRSRHFEAEHRMLHADGSYRWMLARGLAVADDAGRPVRMAGSQTDVTDRKVTDPLTGLPNRTLFTDRLTHALGRAGRRGAPGGLAVLVLDLDRFKVVNDSLGHALGDQLLIGFAHRLAECVGPGETVARLSGDEFAVLLEESPGAAVAVALAEEIQRRLAAPFDLAGQEVFTTVSIGIATSSPGYSRPHELLRDADTAMYRAKSLGRARFQLFEPAMRRQAQAQLRLETDLRRALARRELVVHYQPIVSLADDVITGFEALVRWHHPEFGMLQPADFIPLAEETGQIVPIGLWVLEEATQQIRAWQQEYEVDPPLSVSVNLSPKQFAQPDLVEQVRSVLAASGLLPAALKLEITESAVVEQPEAAAAMLQALRGLGVEVCIDDFGTGYSSLSHLHRFPIDTLKIDRSFISSMGLEPKKADLVRTIVRMARDLGVSVIAEGVETAEQLRDLRSLPCEYMQGFCFSRPLDPETAAQLLSRRRTSPARVVDLLTYGWPGRGKSS